MRQSLSVFLGVSMFMTVLSGMSSHAPAAEPNARAYGLDEVVTLALQRHPAIAAAGGTIKERQGERLAADAYPNPSASGSLGRGAIRDPSNGIAILERTLTIAQPLEWPAKRAARQRAADAGLAGAHAGLEDARLGVQADVKEAFYRLLLAQKDADMASQNLATVSEVLGTVRARLAAGEATRFETVKADVEVQKARKEVSRTANAVIAAQVKLNRLTADALGNDFSIQGDFDSPRGKLDLDTLTAAARDRFPALRRLGKLVEQAEQTVVLERESRIPNVAVSGTYHREAGDESLIGGLSVPIPLWYRRQGEIQAALGAKERAEADRARVENDMVTAISDYVQDARTAHEQIAVFEKGLLKQAEEALGIARFSFKHGAASLLEVLDAQRVYRQMVLEYAQARSAYAIAWARLERWTGGSR